MTTTTAGARTPTEFWGSLEGVCAERDVTSVPTRVDELRAVTGGDLEAVEAALRAVRDGETPMHRSVTHLLSRSGKRLRPLCVALAARVGGPPGPAVTEIAAAAELVHSATLLHDDVVDLGEVRRGAQTARMIYGNAASVYGGDWLLVEALERIQAAGIPGLLERMFGLLRDMLVAEALQLKNRGVLRGAMDDYFRVIDGKTSALFRWALYSGGKAGGCDDDACLALETYGGHLGTAFQLVDDVLDLSGQAAVVGKSLLSDLREGKMTYPLLLAAERDPSLEARLGEACASGEIEIGPALVAHLDRALDETGALEDARALAGRHAARAIEALAPLPDGEARRALEGITVAVVTRQR